MLVVGCRTVGRDSCLQYRGHFGYCLSQFLSSLSGCVDHRRTLGVMASLFVLTLLKKSLINAGEFVGMGFHHEVWFGGRLVSANE
jgi:hypothetical protein